MRIVAGSIVVLSGGILWGFGVLATALKVGASAHHQANIAIVVAAVLVFVGIGVMAIGLVKAE